MSMVIAHNISSLNAQKNLTLSNNSLSSSISKLSSGYRINTGSDSPADLVISEQLRSQVSGLQRAVRNTTEANNVLSIAEGALNEMNNILKSMKALAVHAANSGITSPDQVAADQSEMDSSIQTLERIANSTKYSDQFLLNGSKDLTYSVNSDVKGTQNNKMINSSLSTFQQIFKRDGYSVSIGFNGTNSACAVTAIGNAAMARQAAKAYLEVDAYDGTKSQVDKNGYLTQGQSFILTGTQGARQFNFSEGAHVGEIVSAIRNVAGSTGVDASLIFNRNQTINTQDQKGTAVKDAAKVGTVASYAANMLTIYNNVNADGKAIAEEVEIGADDTLLFGKNTDGQGNIFVKVLGSGATAAYEVYKDESMSAESLIGSGVSAGAATTRNNSELGLKVKLTADAKYGDVLRVSAGGAKLDSGNIVAKGAVGSDSSQFSIGEEDSKSTASGVQLGVNTDTSGKIYLKTVYDAAGTTGTVYAYNNSLMREQDMVAKSKDNVDLATKNAAVILDSIWNDEKTANTGLGMALQVKTAATAAKANATETMDIQFSNIGARIYSSEYGSDSFIKVQQFEGGLFVDYEDAAKYDSAKLIGSDTTYQKNGQDATITVNGQQMKTNGLTLDLATPDIMANITFNAGKAGSTTIAQVGYGDGTVFTKATALTFTGTTEANNGLIANAGHVSKDTIGNFQGGIQLQLGEGAGDQERTVISIQSMATAQLGRLEVTAQFDPSKAITETRTLSIQDVMGGGVADLSSNPAIAMKVIEQAITDVSNARATIGAVQANMLETNANNLNVAIENITKTESNIRDTDMAEEMTEYTKNQIMANAGISMLGQANSQAQAVLTLLS